MKNLLTISLMFFAFSVMGWSQKVSLKGSGPSVTRTLDLPSFSTVECSVSADVEITQGATQKVTIEGQANIVDQIATEVKDGKWRIKLPKNMWSDYDKLNIKITVPRLHGVGMAGSGNITTMNTIKTDDFQIGLSGSGNIRATGNVFIKGVAKELNIGTSGSGNVKAQDCEVEKVKIGISGSGDCLVNASNSLEAGIAGSGSVKYKGHPKVKTSISGSGSISTID